MNYSSGKESADNYNEHCCKGNYNLRPQRPSQKINLLDFTVLSDYWLLARQFFCEFLHRRSTVFYPHIQCIKDSIFGIPVNIRTIVRYGFQYILFLVFKIRSSLKRIRGRFSGNHTVQCCRKRVHIRIRSLISAASVLFLRGKARFDDDS